MLSRYEKPPVLGIFLALAALSLLYGPMVSKAKPLPKPFPERPGRLPGLTTAPDQPLLEMSSHRSPPQIDKSASEFLQDLPTSLTVLKNHTIIRLAPRKKSRRRGVVMKNTRLKPLRAVAGSGCKNFWYQVHVDGWVCGEHVEISRLPPWGRGYPVVPEGEITPWPYGFVREPTIEYRRRFGSFAEVRELLKGFGFGVAGYVNVGGAKYFRTAEGTLIARHAAGVSGRVSEFSGMPIQPETPWPIGFVNTRHAYAYSAASRAKKFRISRVDRYTVFGVQGESSKGRGKFYRFDDNAWLSARDVRVSSTAPLPKGVEPGERWIDVDIKQQIVTAYQGETPVYVTLVSTGRGGPSRTVKGEFRIWVKVAAIAMDNTDEQLEEDLIDINALDAGLPDETKLYSLRDVPWAQFFFKSYALHGVYWHDRFGNRRSHGCVNLAPIDARWFFEWTQPSLPKGWWAMHATPNDRGTLVRAR